MYVPYIHSLHDFKTISILSFYFYSTDLDNFSPSKTCASCDKTNNTDDNTKETSTRENNDGTEV